MIRPCPKCERPTDSDHNSFWCPYCKMLWPLPDFSGTLDDAIDRLSRLYVVRSGDGFVINPVTLKMICCGTSKLDIEDAAVRAHRMSYADAQQIASDLDARGIQAELLELEIVGLTCGGDRGDECHRAYQEIHGGDLGELIHDGTGLVCPACGWRQPPPVGHKLADVVRQLAAAQQRIVELKAVCGEAADFLQRLYPEFVFAAWKRCFQQPHHAQALLEKLRAASEYRPVIVRPSENAERVPGDEAP